MADRKNSKRLIDVIISYALVVVIILAVSATVAAIAYNLFHSSNNGYKTPQQAQDESDYRDCGFKPTC